VAILQLFNFILYLWEFSIAVTNCDSGFALLCYHRAVT